MAGSVFRFSVRWALFPVVVILALNIESRATDAGIDRLTPRAIVDAARMSGLYEVLTSDTALYVSLVLAGAGAFAWLNRLFGGWTSEWLSSVNALSNMCDNIASMMEGFWPFGFRHNEELNKLLVRHGFEAIPDYIDPKDRKTRNRWARYLRAIAPVMKKDVEFAQAMGSAALNLNLAKAVARRSHLGTEKGKRP